MILPCSLVVLGLTYSPAEINGTFKRNKVRTAFKEEAFSRASSCGANPTHIPCAGSLCTGAAAGWASALGLGKFASNSETYGKMVFTTFL